MTLPPEQSPAVPADADIPSPREFITRWFLPVKSTEAQVTYDPPVPPRPGLVRRTAVPAITVLLFAAVFASALPGAPAVLRTQAWRMTSVAALVGIVTNWIAITMLFRPRRRWFGFIQGIIPARRAEVISSVAETVQQRLINPSIIEAHIRESRLIEKSLNRVLRRFDTVLRNGNFRAEFQVVLKASLQAFLENADLRSSIVQQADTAVASWCGQTFGNTLGGLIKPLLKRPANGMVNQLLAELPAAVDHVCGRLTDKLDDVPHRIEPYLPEIERSITSQICQAVRNFDVEALVRQRMSDMDDRAIEATIKQAASSQLMWVQLLGALLGALAGLVVSFL
ncbi:MAG TPA: DUF445 family protein [Phycisphaerae bacterium]|nr:DUF445 family protein [Phycisphaerae bacterium]HUW32019.1 DUF445 family protein [Planctomycetota bacterium]